MDADTAELKVRHPGHRAHNMRMPKPLLEPVHSRAHERTPPRRASSLTRSAPPPRSSTARRAANRGSGHRACASWTRARCRRRGTRACGRLCCCMRWRLVYMWLCVAGSCAQQKASSSVNAWRVHRAHKRHSVLELDDNEAAISLTLVEFSAFPSEGRLLAVGTAKGLKFYPREVDGACRRWAVRARAFEARCAALCVYLCLCACQSTACSWSTCATSIPPTCATPWHPVFNLHRGLHPHLPRARQRPAPRARA